MRLKGIVGIITVLSMWLFVSGCLGYYPSMTGTVIDAETGKPIEGAVVVVEWTKRVGIGDYHTVSVKVVEVVTNRDGKFNVAGIFTPFVETPDMIIYKKGYVAWNNKTIFPDYKRREDFKWKDGTVFRMMRFKEMYSHDEHVNFISSGISSSINFESKKMLFDAFDWERDLAFQERLREKKNR